jgi:hypothetical protein
LVGKTLKTNDDDDDEDDYNHHDGVIVNVGNCWADYQIFECFEYMYDFN